MGQVEQVEAGLQIYVGQVGQEQGGLQIDVEQVGKEQGVCPVEPLHLTQGGTVSPYKFCKNDSFRKLFLFFENTFQFLGGISQDISVSHFDSRRSLSSANRRRCTSLIVLSTLLILVISMTGRSERSARALCDGANVVR